MLVLAFSLIRALLRLALTRKDWATRVSYPLHLFALSRQINKRPATEGEATKSDSKRSKTEAPQSDSKQLAVPGTEQRVVTPPVEEKKISQAANVCGAVPLTQCLARIRGLKGTSEKCLVQRRHPVCWES